MEIPSCLLEEHYLYLESGRSAPNQNTRLYLEPKRSNLFRKPVFDITKTSNCLFFVTKWVGYGNTGPFSHLKVW